MYTHDHFWALDFLMMTSFPRHNQINIDDKKNARPGNSYRRSLPAPAKALRCLHKKKKKKKKKLNK